MDGERGREGSSDRPFRPSVPTDRPTDHPSKHIRSSSSKYIAVYMRAFIHSRVLVLRPLCFVLRILDQSINQSIHQQSVLPLSFFLPMSGTASDVVGMIADTRFMKTVSDRRTVTSERGKSSAHKVNGSRAF